MERWRERGGVDREGDGEYYNNEVVKEGEEEEKGEREGGVEEEIEV